MAQKPLKKTAKTKQKAPSSGWFEQVLSGEKYSFSKLSYFLFILGALVYFNTTSNDFSMDDSLVTRSHPSVIKGISGIPEILTTPYMNDERIKGEFRPISQITFAIEYQFFGENPHVNHFFNIVLFGLICMLIYKLFTRLFGETYHKYIFLGVLIFTVHPLHTEVVASIKNRENILGALLGLLACLQALKHINSGKIKHLFLAVLFLLLAMMAKIDSIVFAFFIVLMAIYKQKYKYILPYFLATVALFVMFILYKSSIAPGKFRNTEFHETPLIGEDNNFLNRFKLSMITLWYYFKLNIFPYPLRFYYGTGLINIPNWANPILWISFVIHSVLLFLGIKGTIKRNFYGFNIMWYLGAIFLFSQLPEPVVGIVAERHAFIASIGFAMLTSYVLFLLYDKLKVYKKEYASTMVMISSTVLVLFLVMTLQRNSDWYDATTLYGVDKKHLEKSIFAHFEMGNQYARDTGVDPNDPIYMKNLMLSVEEYKKVAKAMPDHTSTWYNMGVSYVRAGKYKEAKPIFLKARSIDSTFRSVNHLVAVSSMLSGDTTTAITYFEKELEIKPNNGSSVELLYKLLAKDKRYQQVLDICLPIEQKGIVNERLLKAIANSYYFTGNIDKAMEYRKRLELKNYKEDDNSEW